jgi:hypothetical protein
VINNRVMGELAVSRAFGDCEFKKGLQCIAEEEGMQIASEDRTTNWDDPLIIAEPEIRVNFKILSLTFCILYTCIISIDYDDI